MDDSDADRAPVGLRRWVGFPAVRDIVLLLLPYRPKYGCKRCFQTTGVQGTSSPTTLAG